ncbi:hypothetical protein C8R42DRAFT_686364 [Lentinula raphanica]|nr:hypothetical protein C8R42DRAFT_686364 [Lentinula raphanica]
MTRLPQELIDRFVDEFHDSPRNLKTLSLVARAWSHRARYHLFRSLTLVPQDLQAIRDKYADVKRRASLEFIADPDDYLSSREERFLRSPLAADPQSTHSFLTSTISNALHHVRGVRLLSYIMVGDQGIPMMEYLQKWLGYGIDEAYASYRLKWTSLSNEDLQKRQKAQWDAVDRPWGRGTGLHALPFRNLRFIHIEWSVFGWTPPSERGVVGLTNLDHWPGYQLAKLFESNADTLDHVFIDEYPGFQLNHYNSTSNGDTLLEVLAQNAPNLQSLSLRGLRQPFYAHFHTPQPEGYENYVLADRPRYPSGEEIPHVMSDDNSLLERTTKPSLERLHIQGFGPESTLLIEDAIFNRSVLSMENLSHLALCVMPEDYDYMFMFSKVRGSLTHLTLDLRPFASPPKLKFCFFPKLKCLQLIIYSVTAGAEVVLHTVVESLSDNLYCLNGSTSMPVVQAVKQLHISVEPDIYTPLAESYLNAVAIDELLENLVCGCSDLPETMGRSRVNEVTVEWPQRILAEMLPLTYQTGHLKEGKLNNWWYKPAYLL